MPPTPPVLTPPVLTISHATDGQPRTPVDAERLISGQPATVTANAYSSDDQRFHCGIWESDIGAWRVSYAEHELCHMLEGKVRMVGDDGRETVVVAGDSFVIPAGFTGIWEVLAPARKLYAVYEPES